MQYARKYLQLNISEKVYSGKRTAQLARHSEGITGSSWRRTGFPRRPVRSRYTSPA